MKYNYYIASKWRNETEVKQLTNTLRERGFSVYSFMENKEDILPGKTAEEKIKILESIENWKDNPTLKEIFEKDLEGLKNSETILLLLPAGPNAHIEAGIAFGLGKKCILIGKQETPERSYKIFSEIYETKDDFLGTLE
ncbi:hypothetical protein ACFL0W_01005 [Nanoarchaeota archaeon]